MVVNILNYLGSPPVGHISDPIRTFIPDNLVACTVDHARSIITEAADQGLSVRIMGPGYTWATHHLCADVCIKPIGLNRIHAIDTRTGTITVDAGVKLGEVTRALALHGLALPSLSFFPNVTIGGAIATGTHGTSPKWGTLSDFVISIDIMLATGEIKTFGPQSNPQELRAARTAVGMLGLVVRVELQAIEMPWVRFSEIRMDLKAFRKQLASVLVQHDHVWARWQLGLDIVQIDCLEARFEPAEGFHRYVDDANCCWRPPKSPGRQRVSDSARYLKEFLGPKLCGSAFNPAKLWMSMQYAVPASHMNVAIDLLHDSSFADRNAGKIVELKFLRRSDLSYLGPNAGCDAVLFNLWWLVDEDARAEVFADFEKLMRSIRARPHWGKHHRPPDVEYMKTSYGRWRDFEAVRARLDPHNMFSIFPDQFTVKQRTKILVASKVQAPTVFGLTAEAFA